MEEITPQFASSSSGTLGYVPPAAHSLVWVDRKGRAKPVGAPRRTYTGPRLSPDGRRLAVGIAGDRGYDIWTYDLARGTMTRLTPEGGVLPTWTPDGKWVTFSLGEVWNLFRVAADGSGKPERLIVDPTVDQLIGMDRFASQIAALDFVITISNSGAHLTGALNQRAKTAPAVGGR